MDSINECLINETADIRDTIRAIESGKKGIAVVVDHCGTLQGVVTDRN